MSNERDGNVEQWHTYVQAQAESQRSWLKAQARITDAFTAVTSTADVPDAPEVDLFPDAKAFADLWRTWTGLATATAAAAGQPSSSGYNPLLDPLALSRIGADQVSSAIRRITEGPQLADLGKFERKMGRAFELYLSVQSLQRAYEAVITSVWVKANQQYTEEATRGNSAGQLPSSPRQALRRWLEIANDTFVQTHRSTEFLEAQRALLGASMDLTLAQREILEQLLEPAGLPTRTEMDEVHHTVQELKRRIRQLEKAARNNADPGRPV